MNNKLLELRGIIVGCYKTITNFNEALGWSRQKTDKIINGKQSPSLDDLQKIAVALGILPSELINYFLN